MAKDELNVPSLIVVLVVSGLLIRHFFFRGSGSSSADASSQASRTGQSREQRNAEALNRRYEDAVAQIQQIFPYIDRRDVWWELRRNGLNINVATERILSGGLDNPPVSFQPPPLPVPAASATASGNDAGTAAASGSSSSKPSQPSLIQRYRLESQVRETTAQESVLPASSSPASSSKTKSWSSNRAERQALLKKRRDDMILEARRKMEAKLAAEKAAGGA